MVSPIPGGELLCVDPAGWLSNLGFQKQLLDVSQPSWCEVSSEARHGALGAARSAGPRG